MDNNQEIKFPSGLELKSGLVKPTMPTNELTPNEQDLAICGDVETTSEKVTAIQTIQGSVQIGDSSSKETLSAEPVDIAQESDANSGNEVESIANENTPGHDHMKREQDNVNENTNDLAPITNAEDNSSQDKGNDEVSEETHAGKVKDFLEGQTQETVEKFSDDEISLDDSSSDSDSDNVSSLSESSLSDSSLSDSSDSSDDEQTNNNEEIIDELEEEEEGSSGPILSKNEVSDEAAPTLPSDYKVVENAPLELVGTITSLVEKNIIIKANISGEFRVLKENSVLCLEDRQVIGPLFETFGRLQAPNYRIKFNTDEEFEKFKDKKGAKVFYVVPDSQFLYTDAIKKAKGTDASNCHDEELPEEEQEFSDDEQELAAKQEKKKKKKQKQRKNDQGTGEPAKKKHQTNSDQKFVSYGFASNLTPATLPSTPQYGAQYHHHGTSPQVKPYLQSTENVLNPYGVPINQVQPNPYGQPYPYQQAQNQFYPQPGYSNAAQYQNIPYQNAMQFQQQPQYQQHQQALLQLHAQFQPQTSFQQQQQMQLQHVQPTPLSLQTQHASQPYYAQYQQQGINQSNYPQAQWPQATSEPSALHQLQQLVANRLTQNQHQQGQEPPGN